MTTSTVKVKFGTIMLFTVVFYVDRGWGLAEYGIVAVAS